MFEFLFAQSSAIARYRSAPLLGERIRYLAHCKQIGIKLETLRKIASHQLSLVSTLDLRPSPVARIYIRSHQASGTPFSAIYARFVLSDTIEDCS